LLLLFASTFVSPSPSQFGPNVNFIFETHSLKFASPVRKAPPFTMPFDTKNEHLRLRLQCHFMLKTIILTRQARDNHRGKNTQKESGVLFSAGDGLA